MNKSRTMILHLYTKKSFQYPIIPAAPSILNVYVQFCEWQCNLSQNDHDRTAKRTEWEEKLHFYILKGNTRKYNQHQEWLLMHLLDLNHVTHQMCEMVQLTTMLFKLTYEITNIHIDCW